MGIRATPTIHGRIGKDGNVQRLRVHAAVNNARDLDVAKAKEIMEAKGMAKARAVSRVTWGRKGWHLYLRHLFHLI